MKKLLIIAGLLFCATTSSAFMTKGEGCGAGSCTDCHNLTTKEANQILQQIDGDVTGVTPAEVPGLWRVDMKMKGKTWPLYLDFSKSYLISGNIIQLKSRKNLTESHFRELNPIDISTIPTEDALLMGKPDAPIKVIVFTDPHCPYCSKLHQEIKKALKVRPDIAWQIKLIPIKKGSREAAETILCERSLELLDQAFAGKHLAQPTCTSTALKQTTQLAKQLGIRSTPTLIMPNGQLVPGYKQLDHLLQAIDDNTPADADKSAAQQK